MTVDVSDPDNPLLISDALSGDTPDTGPGRDFAANDGGIGLLIGSTLFIPNILDVIDTTAPPVPDGEGNPHLDPDSLLTRFFLPAQPQAVEIASGVCHVIHWYRWQRPGWLLRLGFRWHRTET